MHHKGGIVVVSRAKEGEGQQEGRRGIEDPERDVESKIY